MCPKLSQTLIASRRVDLIMASMAYLSGASAKPGNADMEIVGPRFQGGILGRGSSVGLRKSDPELKTMFDEAEHEEDRCAELDRCGGGGGQLRRQDRHRILLHEELKGGIPVRQLRRPEFQNTVATARRSGRSV
jgi:hypothetical protein